MGEEETHRTVWCFFYTVYCVTTQYTVPYFHSVRCVAVPQHRYGMKGENEKNHQKVAKKWKASGQRLPKAGQKWTKMVKKWSMVEIKHQHQWPKVAKTTRNCQETVWSRMTRNAPGIARNRQRIGNWQEMPKVAKGGQNDQKWLHGILCHEQY